MNRLLAAVLVAVLLGCGGEPIANQVPCATASDCVGTGCCIDAVCVEAGASGACVFQGSRCTSDEMCPSGSCEQQNADPNYLTCGSIH